MLKKTPLLALFIAVLISAAVIYLFELSVRPFTVGQKIILYILSYSVALGIALLFDQKAKDTRKKYLKINFYEEK